MSRDFEKHLPADTVDEWTDNIAREHLIERLEDLEERLSVYRSAEESPMSEPVANVRRWTAESGKGRADVHGIEWFACDPYPTWYRWEGDTLVTPSEYEPVFADAALEEQ